MVLSLHLRCEPDLIQLTLWGALSLISVSSLLFSAKIAGPHWYGLTTSSRAALRKAHCKLLFQQVLAGSWSDFPQFCLYLTSAPSSAVSLCCLKQMRWKRAISSTAARARAPGKQNSCIHALAEWRLPQSSSGCLVASEGAGAPWVHLCRWGPKEAFCWVSPLRAIQGSPILLFQDRLCPRPPLWEEVILVDIIRSWGKLYFSMWSAGRREHLDRPSLTPLSSRYSGSGFALSNQINLELPPSAGILFDHSWCGSPDVGDPLLVNRALLPAPLLPTTHSACCRFAWPFPCCLCCQRWNPALRRGYRMGSHATQFLLKPCVQGWHSVSHIGLCLGLLHGVVFFLSYPTQISTDETASWVPLI